MYTLALVIQELKKLPTEQLVEVRKEIERIQTEEMVFHAQRRENEQI